jgi:hypothetical protein
LASTLLSFTSVDHQRGSNSSDCVVVQCDADRPDGLPVLVGQTVGIDGALYHVVGADGLEGPLCKGERMVLWVEAAAREKR